MLPSFTAEENQSSLVSRGLPLNVLSDELFVRMVHLSFLSVAKMLILLNFSSLLT